MTHFAIRPITLTLASALAMPAAMAAGFLPDELLVSRTVYSGVASTVVVGQALPGGGVATDNGLFPNVFKNEVPDPSFGVTSAIYIDQLTRSGTLLGTLAIDTSLVATSFASKSELALNLSTDGSAFTFMGYQSPVNALDVSNSNTATVFDSTNPVGTTVSRAVVQVSLSTGAVQTTSVDAYSGNNGRAAVLANGSYYMVGNAGNGSGNGTQLSQLSDDTGVQRIAVGSSGATTAVGAAKGTFGATTGYQRGFALQDVTDPNSATNAKYAADKTGKDDNFRGMTVYNGTMYVTKGSGSNGVNTVYQVGAAGALNNGGTLSNANIAILPGFNTLSEKVAEAPATLTATPHPFGLWFANSTTLFVADEGDGVRLGVAGKNTSFAGLQEWTLNGGFFEENQQWQLLGRENLLSDFVLKNLDASISFNDVDVEIYSVDARDIGGGDSNVDFSSIKKREKQKLNEIIRNQSDAGQIDSLVFRLFQLLGKNAFYPIDDNDIKAYLKRIVENMTSEQRTDCLEKDYAYIKKIKEKITSLANAYGSKIFAQWLTTQKIEIRPYFQLPQSVSPSDNAPAIEKSLYIKEGWINTLESKAIGLIAKAENITWWHRNLQRGVGFVINGFLNHYPDFIILTEKKNIIILETKGPDRDNNDSKDKLRLGKAWEGKANELAQNTGYRYHYMMVFETNQIEGALSLTETIETIKEL